MKVSLDVSGYRFVLLSALRPSTSRIRPLFICLAMYAWYQSGLPNRQNDLIESVAYMFSLAHARFELASIKFKMYGQNLLCLTLLYKVSCI